MALKVDPKYQREVKCVICARDNFKIVWEFAPNRYDHNNYITHSWDGGQNVSLTIVKCKNCGFIYQDSIFKDDQLHLLYPESIIPEKLNEKNFNKNFSHLWNTVQPFLNKKENFALDIGARFGGLSNYLQKKGLNAIGIEMNPACVKAGTAYGIKGLHTGKIDDLPSILKTYNRTDVDLITMVDVIEHLTEAEKDFNMLSSIQTKGQLFALTTMFTDSVGRYLFGKEWYYIHAQHTLYFSRKTIVEFLEKFGYEVIKIEFIPLYKNIKPAPKEILKYIRHKWHLAMKTKYSPKKWFADDRPHCLDLMTVIAKRK